MNIRFEQRLAQLQENQEKLLIRKNYPTDFTNGVFQRFQYPILTHEHTPYFWRYDLDKKTNPYLMERIGINAVFNAGAIFLNGRYLLVARVEGSDRKSFFAVAESPNGIDQFRFWHKPLNIPVLDEKETNIYDMRLTLHEDGWIYGIFCTEKRDESAPEGDQTAAIAQCGIIRTHDLENWERLPDLITPSPQQRNVVLHPEFINGKYAFYTRPQDSFIEAGNGGGLGMGLVPDINRAVIEKETVIDKKVYHTISEAKNGLGPAPLKTSKGWLHMAHGVRNTAAGLRYVLYLFMTDLHDIGKIIYKPAGYFIAPEGEERIGDVSNVVFCNGWIAEDNGRVLIYYASSDTRMHVAESSVEQLLDYVMHTPADGLTSASAVKNINQLIAHNQIFLKEDIV